MGRSDNSPHFLWPEDIATADIPRATVRGIAEEVADLTGVPLARIFGKQRHREVCLARQMVCFIAHRHGMSYAQIGRALGRDHSTVLQAVRNEKKRRSEISITHTQSTID